MSSIADVSAAHTPDSSQPGTYCRIALRKIAGIYERRGWFTFAAKFFSQAGDIEGRKRTLLLSLAKEFEKAQRLQEAIWIYEYVNFHTHARILQQQLEDYLKFGELIPEGLLYGGNNGLVQVFKIKGTNLRLVFKGQKTHRENFRAEIFASAVDEALRFNLVPTVVERQIDGEFGSAQPFVFGMMGEDHFLKVSKIPRMDFEQMKILDSNRIERFEAYWDYMYNWGSRTQLFDFSIGNIDRHLLNIKVIPEILDLKISDLFFGKALIDNSGSNPQRPIEVKTESREILLRGQRSNGVWMPPKNLLANRELMKRYFFVNAHVLEVALKHRCQPHPDYNDFINGFLNRRDFLMSILLIENEI